MGHENHAIVEGADPGCIAPGSSKALRLFTAGTLSVYPRAGTKEGEWETIAEGEALAVLAAFLHNVTHPTWDGRSSRELGAVWACAP